MCANCFKMPSPYRASHQITLAKLPNKWKQQRRHCTYWTGSSVQSFHSCLFSHFSLFRRYQTDIVSFVGWQECQRRRSQTWTRIGIWSI